MKLQTWLEQNPFTLALSSGFFGFFAHAGFVKALEENGLRPQRLTGSSAGAIISACLASGMRVRDIEDLILAIRREDFWDPFPGPGVLRGKKFEKLLLSALGDSFDKLKTPLQVSTYDILSLNTRTFSSGNLAKAVRASCAIPVMFHPVRIGLKYYWDGGVLDKAAMNGISENDHVLSHFLQSDKFVDSFEKDPRSKIKGPNHKLLMLKDLPRSGPHRLTRDRGAEIIAAAYRQTLSALGESI